MPPQVATGTSPAKRARVLVVDDNASNREIMIGQLNNIGLDAEAVESGDLALALLEGRSFDAVLMDCHMPRLDGYQTTQRLRAAEGGARHTVVIAVTAHALHGERQRCLAAGMDDYLPKPFRSAELGLVLARWLPGAVEVPATSAAAAVSAGGALGPPVDLEPAALDQLRRLGVLVRVLDIFTEGVGPHLEALRAALEAGEWPRAREIARTLRGTSAQLGAREYSRLCEGMETGAERRSLTQANVVLHELIRATPPLLAEIRRIRGLEERP